MKKYNVKVIDNENFGDNTFILRVEKPKGFSFKAGQFVMLYNGEAKRAFSISSPPSKDAIDLLIKKHEGGAISPFFYDAKKGDEAVFSGPFCFFSRKEDEKDVLFISSGVGLAPQVSMIIDSLENNPKRKITLIFGFRNGFPYEKELRNLEEKYKNFELCACCTNPKKEWDGFVGRVTEHLK